MCCDGWYRVFSMYVAVKKVFNVWLEWFCSIKTGRGTGDSATIVVVVVWNNKSIEYLEVRYYIGHKWHECTDFDNIVQRCKSGSQNAKSFRHEIWVVSPLDSLSLSPRVLLIKLILLCRFEMSTDAPSIVQKKFISVNHLCTLLLSHSSLWRIIISNSSPPPFFLWFNGSINCKVKWYKWFWSNIISCA